MSHFTDPAQLTRQGDAATDKAKPGGPRKAPARTTAQNILPYVVPMFAYVGLTALEGYVPQLLGKPHQDWYPIAYALKLALVVSWPGIIA